MNKNGNILTSGAVTILHSLVVPVFTLAFLALYQPFGISESLQLSGHSFNFNLTILFCIFLVSMSMTRVWLYFIGRHKKILRSVYAVWCLGEVLVASMFSSLYITLMMGGSTMYFNMVGASFAYIVSASIYPFALLWISVEFYYYKKNQEEPVAEENSLIRFYDEYQKLKLVIASEAIIFIKSEDNYVQIHYSDKGKPNMYMLRSSMRALENTLSKHGLVRCHRSYFINPSYIKIVCKDGLGLVVAHLRIDGFEPIPISRKYHDEITKLL